jgi:hypothetical protein
LGGIAHWLGTHVTATNQRMPGDMLRPADSNITAPLSEGLCRAGSDGEE